MSISRSLLAESFAAVVTKKVTEFGLKIGDSTVSSVMNEVSFRFIAADFILLTRKVKVRLQSVITKVRQEEIKKEHRKEVSFYP